MSVVVRNDQQPNALNAIQFADSNVKFVAAISQTTNSASSTATTRNIDTSVPTAANIASSTPANCDSTSAPTPLASSSVSVGVKASIAVGAVGGALAVGTLIFYLFVCWRQSVHRNDKSPAHSPGRQVFTGIGSLSLPGNPRGRRWTLEVSIWVQAAKWVDRFVRCYL